MSFISKRISHIIFMLSMLLVSGCGGGGSNPAPPDTVSGVAAAGSVMVGEVHLKDSSATPKFLVKQTTDGSYSFDVTGLSRPFLLRATGTAGVTPYTLYSVAVDKGTANINPMSNLIVAYAAEGADLAAIYAASTAAGVQEIAGRLAQAGLVVQGTLRANLQEYPADAADPISDPYRADHTGLDGMFDALDFLLSGSVLTITEKDSPAAVLFTGNLAVGFTTFTVSGKVLSAGAGLAGVTVRVEDAITGALYGSQVTAADGSYLLSGIPAGSYAVIPTRTGYTFDRTKTVQVVTGDSSVPDFTASAVTPPGTGGVTIVF